MMDPYDIIIIGAGPAGLFCAMNCAEIKKLKVLVLEKNQSAGRKLLLSGSGRCNITHTGTVSDFTKHYGKAGNFTKPALSCFTPSDMIEFLHENNILTTETDNGKVFPESMHAGDVLSMMISLCESRGVTLKYRSSVTGIEYNKDTFTVYSGKHKYTASALVIAAGGSSYPATGSTGDGYLMAGSLGHSIIEPAPALTPVYVRDFTFTALSGMSIRDTNISLFRKEKKINSSTGDVLFTHKGLSGPGILDMSRYIRKDDVMKISLTGNSTEKMNSNFIAGSRDEGKKNIKSFLKRFDIPERLITKILSQQKIDPGRKVSEITREERVRLFNTLCEYPFTVEEKGGFNIAMATCGGVCRDEINRFTMESKIVPGLYFAGEVIDVDGDTGGYNIQWAFSSGKLAAESIRGESDLSIPGDKMKKE